MATMASTPANNLEGKLCALAQQQAALERQLRAVVEEEAAHAHECFEHEAAYQKHCQEETVATLEKDLCQSQLENHQLRLEVHRWRKQHALLKLRLAGAQEDCELQAGHARQLEARLETLEAQRAELSARVGELGSLHVAAKDEAARLKEDLGGASEDQCRLSEQVRLATVRATAATETARAMEDALASARRDVDAAREQLAALRQRESESAAAQARLAGALEAAKAELASTKRQLLDADEARSAADAAAAEARAAAKLAAERLAIKERELAEWRAIDHERKETLQRKEAHLETLMAERIEGLKAQSTVAESRLLDQVAALRRELEHERSTRMAHEDEARRSAADAATAGTRVAALERQLAALQRSAADRSTALVQARAQLLQTEERLGELEAAGLRSGGGAGGASGAGACAAAAAKWRENEQRAAHAFDAVAEIVDDLAPEPAPAPAMPLAAAGRAKQQPKKLGAGAKRQPAQEQQQQQYEHERWPPTIPEGDEEGEEEAAEEDEAPAPPARAALRPIADAANADGVGPSGGSGGKAAARRQAGKSAAARAAAAAAAAAAEQEDVEQDGDDDDDFFASQAADDPLAGMLQPGAQAGASRRQSLSVTDLLGKLGPNNIASKPGAARKRKIAVGSLPNAASMSTMPAHMLLGMKSSQFNPPRVVKPRAK